jgi:hypothetical protein
MLFQAKADDLAEQRFEDEVDVHQLNHANNAADMENRRFAKSDHQNVNHSAALNEIWLLSIRDKRGAIARPLGHNFIANRLGLRVEQDIAAGPFG